MFTNSLYNGRNVNSLLARGNKTKILKRMITFHENTKLNQGECNQVTIKIASHTKQNLYSEKGVRQNVMEHNANTSGTPLGLKPIKGKEGGGSKMLHE